MFDERFDGWTPKDFEAYAKSKWRSNRFNLERQRVRLRLMDLLERATATTAREGLVSWATHDHPNFFNGHEVRNQRAVWTRDETLRERMMRADPAVDAARVDRCHAHVGLELDADALYGVLVIPEQARFDLPLSEEAPSITGDETTLTEQGDGWSLRRKLLVKERAVETSEEDTLALATSWLSEVWSEFESRLWSRERDPQQRYAGLPPAIDEQPAPQSTTDDAEPKAAAPAPRGKVAPWRSRSRQTIAPAGSGREAREDERKAEAKRRARQPQPARGKPQRANNRQGERSSYAKEERRGDKRGGERGKRGAGGAPPRRDRPYEARPTKSDRPRFNPGDRVELSAGLFAGKSGVIKAFKSGQAVVDVDGMELRVHPRDLRSA